MKSKMKIAVGILVTAIIITSAFFVYTRYFNVQEENVTVASITTGFDTSSSSTSADVSIQQEAPAAGNHTANVKVQNMSRERYRNRWRNQSGNATMKQTQGRNGTGGANVSVQITFELEFPNGTKKTFSFNPPQNEGVGRKEFQSVLGSNELENTTGNFTLWVTIDVSVTPPNHEDPVVNKTLGPIERTFTIPETEG